MLADDRAVESVSFGESGILAHLQPGSVHISSSTISVDLSQKLAAARENRTSGLLLLRPPVMSAVKLLFAMCESSYRSCDRLDSIASTSVSIAGLGSENP